MLDTHITDLWNIILLEYMLINLTFWLSQILEWQYFVNVDIIITLYISLILYSNVTVMCFFKTKE